jgi:uncharacterized protein (DUF302 family)
MADTKTEGQTPAAGIVSKISPASVADTVAKLLGLLEQKGVQVFTVVDHSGAAKEHGIDLRDTKLVIFGSPVAGTPVMQVAPLAALDLPLKILIWDNAGVTTLSYVSPLTLAARYGLSEELADRLKAVEVIAGALATG